MNKSNGWVTLTRKHPIAEYISSLYGFVFLASGELSIGTWDKKVFSLQSKETGKKIYIIEDFVWFKSNLSDDHNSDDIFSSGLK